MFMVMALRISYARRILVVIILCCHTEVVYLGAPSVRCREVKLRRRLFPGIWTSGPVVLLKKTQNLADFVATILS